MNKTFLLAGTVLAGLAVVLGAFGAHGLKKVADSATVEVFQTGVQYQLYHAFALLTVGILAERFGSSFTVYAGGFFIGGTICFSGSLYLITALKVAGKVIPKGVGIITPVGGLLFITGWVMLLVALLRNKM